MPTSEELFREKLTILNENFVCFIQGARKIKPAADFTSSINDYLKHIEELDELYGENTTMTVEKPSVFSFGTSTAPTLSTSSILGTLSVASFGTTSNFNCNVTSASNFGPSTTSSFTAPKFSFGQPTITNGEEVSDNEAEPTEPPVPDEVEQSEKDAICSFKCVIYNLLSGKYEKKGAAYVSIKLLADGKKQLIIREATAIGRLWTNTVVNDKFKWLKIASKKLRISYPNNKEDEKEETSSSIPTNKEDSGSGAITILLRLGTDDELDKLTKEFDSTA